MAMVILSASVEKFSVSHMRDFFFFILSLTTKVVQKNPSRQNYRAKEQKKCR